MFIDCLKPEQLIDDIAEWRLLDFPEELKERHHRTSLRGFYEVCLWYRERQEALNCLRFKSNTERRLIHYIYGFIRLNIKRGRIFNLPEVIKTGEADCLGYSKLFTILGRQCGLKAGVVEVIIDNRGYAVPHTAILVNLADGRRQIIDCWYGSENIRHKRLGLRVKSKGRWNVEDIDLLEIKRTEDISFLPDALVDSITLYIEGNRLLKAHDYSRAIEKFSEAIVLYPQNSRIYYNRGIGYEHMGQIEKAQTDFARALQDDNALIRILATQPQSVIDLIQLDKNFVSEENQEIYLLNKGFITGRPVPQERIAFKKGIYIEEVGAILTKIEKMLKIISGKTDPNIVKRTRKG